jgi:hypothetical protein
MSSFSSTVILYTRSAPITLATATTALAPEPGNLNVVMANRIVIRLE